MSHTLKGQLSNRILTQICPVRASFSQKIASINSTERWTPAQKADFIAHEEAMYAAAVPMYTQYVLDVIDKALQASPAAPVIAALNTLKGLVSALAAVSPANAVTNEHQAVIDYVNHLDDDLQSIEVPY